MYGALVVDDEKYIRRSIINRIHWKECGVEVVGEAADGREAFDMIALNQPDIVITDIRMPGTDGLRLSEKIAAEYPHIRIIIISAYNDFDYARKAIRYGVREYLLKPVAEEELETALRRLCAELEADQSSYQVPEISPDSVEKKKFKGDSFLITSFFLSEIRDEVCCEERISKLYQALALQAEAEQEGLELFFLREGSGEQCSFLWAGKGMTERKVYLALKKARSEDMEERSASVGLSGVLQGESMKEAQLLKLQSEAVTALKGKIFGGGQVWYFSKVTQKEASLEKYKNDLLQLYELSVQEDWEKLKLLLKEMIIYKLSGAASVLELEFLVGELIFALERISRRLGYLYETRVLFHDLKKSDFLLRFESVEKLASVMEELSDTVLSYRCGGKRYDALEEIRDYVQQHFAEDLSVAHIAGKYHMNAAYLSTVFSSRNNISLSAYIEGVRMEKAKKFLRQDWGNITEAALATGYSDSNYFTKVFKKYTGMTPSQWKRSAETSK